jgi:hypothetical protein
MNIEPGLSLDGDTPTFRDMGIGDVAEDGNLALCVNRTADGAVVGKSDINGICGHLV